MTDVRFAGVPAHMLEDAEFHGHWSPEFYEEGECVKCGKPIYRYRMDVVVEWKHFNHAAYCNTDRATPAH